MFLSSWIEWIARIIQANRHTPDFSVGIASSPWLCRALQDIVGPIETFIVNPVDVLRPFHMDRVRYAQDLARAGHEAVGNKPLDAAITAFAADLRPDAIISFTQNRYLAALSPSICTLFAERQPLPRTLGTGFFLDPSGHQTESLLVKAAQRIRSVRLSPERERALEKNWENSFTIPNRNHPETDEMLAWFSDKTKGAPVAMLALQPPDWLTVEGLSDGTTVDGLLLAWLDALPANWCAVATYHPGHKLSRLLEESIAEQMPRLMLLPDSWNQGRSEWLLQAVDAVVTVSSVVGWTALLAGKRTLAMGRSNMRGFAAATLMDIDNITPLTVSERSRLAAFLMSRYCIPTTRFLDEKGCIPDIISSIKMRGEDYFFEKVLLDDPCSGSMKVAATSA